VGWPTFWGQGKKYATEVKYRDLLGATFSGFRKKKEPWRGGSVGDEESIRSTNPTGKQGVHSKRRTKGNYVGSSKMSQVVVIDKKTGGRKGHGCGGGEGTAAQPPKRAIQNHQNVKWKLFTCDWGR